MLEVLTLTDAQALMGIAEICHRLQLTRLMELISLVGNSGACWIALGGLLLLFRRTRWLGVAVMLSLVLSSLITEGLLKDLVARPRPCSVFMPSFITHCPHSPSFPSGHTTAAFAAAGVLLFLGCRWAWVAIVAALLMGLSRMALFVHYPTDVMGGIVVGLASAFVVAWGLRRWQCARRNRMNNPYNDMLF